MDFLTLKKSNCKNCHKCIRNCPVKSIRFSGNQAYIISNECILCGHCFVVCPQDAKQIVDETEKVKVLIQSGEPVIASLAPSFIANFEGTGINSLRTALKKLGFYEAEETAIGATIVKKEYDRMCEENEKDVIISSCCHSINLLIQKHFPELINHLADTLSPMQAHCKDIKRRNPNAKTVFIGPCVSKKDEAAHYEGIVDAVLTFEELAKWFAEEDISLDMDIDDKKESKTRLFPTTGGILKTMEKKNPDYTYLAIDGVDNCIAALKDIKNGNIHKCFIEMSACAGSCIGGPIMEKYHNSPIRHYKDIIDYAGDKDFNVEQPKQIDLIKQFDIITQSGANPSEKEIKEIMKQMGKYSSADELNCGTCGYNTCREKAIAVIEGKAEISMCLPYLMDRAENFTDTITRITPNGIVILNESLEVQQINKNALNIFNLKDDKDILGENVVNLLDTTDFITALYDGKVIRNKHEYLSEYRKYVEKTIVYDKNYRLILCILHDVSKEETQRVKKENISKQTIEIADKVVDKQMRIVQEIASLLGETTAETKIALTKLKESISDE